MNLLFRTDGGTSTDTRTPRSVGVGHLSRVANLIDAFGRPCRPHVVVSDPLAAAWLKARGLGHSVLSSRREADEARELAALCRKHDSDCVFVDRLNTDYSDDYFDLLRRETGQFLACIDDYGNKRMAADAIFNYTVVDEWHDYPESGNSRRILIGPAYAVVKKEFAGYHERRPVADEVGKVTITTGGADPLGASLGTAKAVLGIGSVRKANVVVGPFFGKPLLAKLRALAVADPRLRLIEKAKSLAPLLGSSDFAFVSSGLTPYECACVGTPFAAINQMEHQDHTSRAFERLGAGMHLGLFGKFDMKRAMGEVAALFADPGRRRAMAESGMKLVDGQGTERVWAALKAALG